jgi:anti-sigma-K factor RskA
MHPSPDLLALLALGETAGTPAERDHVASCPQCRGEVADLARAVAAGRNAGLGDSGLIRPPDRVWAAIRADLELGRPADPNAAEGSDADPATALPHAAQSVDAKEPGPQIAVSSAGNGQRRSRRVLALALAAVLALVVGIGLGVGLNRLLAPRQTVLWTAQLQALPAHSGSSGEALVEEDSEGNKTLVIKLSSPPPVDGAQEVWLIDRGVSKMQSLGHLTPSSNRFNIPADLDPRQYPVVDISQEPPDGKPTHSGDSIVRGTLNV